MTYKLKRQLKKLSSKQFAEDIKKYISSPHKFYDIRVPELKTLAKRLHEEHSLKEFYVVFNRLWNSSYHEENSLAIYALQLYKDEFNLNTWKFLKPKIKNIKSWDQIDNIASNIVGYILLNYPRLEREILRTAKNGNIWLKRMAIVSTLPLIRNGDIKLTLKIAEIYLYDKEPHIQKAIGWMLREAEKQKPEKVKNFVLKHMYMPAPTFIYATENMRDLRKIRKLKKLKSDNVSGFFLWKLMR
tara:strand:+ start:613 stop:1341 length:729 start_codon:yes stop_codon:yes gene_type:complete